MYYQPLLIYPSLKKCSNYSLINFSFKQYVAFFQTSCVILPIIGVSFKTSRGSFGKLVRGFNLPVPFLRFYPKEVFPGGFGPFTKG